MKNKDFEKWYSEKGGKEYMKKFMGDYYKKNKMELKLYQKERRRKQKYDRPLKDVVRNRIMEIIERRKIKTILTLESPQFIFAKKIPEKKIIVFENDLKNYEKMEKKKPKNVTLFLGDVSKFNELGSKVDMVYLDFCSNWTGAKESIYLLKNSIQKTKIFGVTLCIRDSQNKWDGDYQLDIVKRLRNLLELNLEIIYGESYSDKAGMITIIFEVKNEKEINT